MPLPKLFLPIAILLIAVLPFVASAEKTQFTYKGLQDFNTQEQDRIKQWMSVVANAAHNTLGSYPFEVELHFQHRQSNQPVPWANTWREQVQSIYYYIDLRFPQQAFIEDWTAYHEISHLALPYLGSSNRWFAEGFASFMQYQLMDSLEQSSGSPELRYTMKLTPHLKHFQSTESPFIIVKRLFEQRNYKPAYWGSAWFFILADAKLKQQGSSLTSIVRDYLLCCRNTDSNLVDVISSWDKLADKPLFQNLLRTFKQQPANVFFADSENILLSTP